jgi:hypothetical protein
MACASDDVLDLREAFIVVPGERANGWRRIF